MDTKSKKKILSELANKIKKCRKCGLYRTRIKTVPGEGLANTKFMFVGQNPGFTETEFGKPFIGRAGKLLNELLKIAKIDRKKIFITSILKCPTPKNRKPTKKEIEACLPYLKKQIRIIKPQKFILLGEVAFSVFFSDKKLSDFRGKWVKKDGKEYFITYHPAAGLRFPKIRTCLRRDFAAFGRALIR